jgi:hypothetical protein
LSYRPARLHELAESVPWNRFLGSLKVLKYRLWTGVEERQERLDCNSKELADDQEAARLPKEA